MASQALSFSSYPGELFSDDDFYITSNKLVVLETTNHIYNFSILQVSCPAQCRSRLQSTVCVSERLLLLDTLLNMLVALLHS